MIDGEVRKVRVWREECKKEGDGWMAQNNTVSDTDE